MKTSSQRLPESQVLLEIEVDDDQMQRSLDKAYRRLAQRIEVPGFRKGKTPRNMLERHVGRGRLVSEAIDILIPEAYNQAIEIEDVDAIGQPSIELTNVCGATIKNNAFGSTLVSRHGPTCNATLVTPQVPAIPGRS